MTSAPTTSQDEQRPRTLDAATLQDWLAAGRGPRLLDVRTPAEFTTAHVPGSSNVPLDLLREHGDVLSAHLDEGDVVVICRTGTRAGQAGELLSTTGVRDVHVLTGGVVAWEGIGAPLRRGAETWELERQVRLVAGGVVLAGVLASTVVPWAKWVSAGIGAGLTGAALTDTCAMGALISRLPWNRRGNPDLGTVVESLAARAS